MANSKSASAQIYEAIPQMGRLHEEVLLGVLKGPELSYRDRVFINCGALAALGWQEDLKNWMTRGVAGGITQQELRGIVAQVTFYAGWPAGLTAGQAALALLELDA